MNILIEIWLAYLLFDFKDLFLIDLNFYLLSLMMVYFLNLYDAPLLISFVQSS
jgi:hypothetical protein